MRHEGTAVALLLVACGGGANEDAGIANGGAAGSGGSRGSSSTDAGGAAGAPTADNPIWETLSPLDGVRQEHAVVALDGRVCVIGGFAPGVTDSVACYTPQSQTWSSIAPFPEPLHHGNAAGVGGRIFVLGYMYDLAFSTTGRSYVYDPATDDWSPVASMPAGRERGAAGVTVRGGEIFVIGGASGTAGAAVDIYDPASDTWRPGPDLPAPREHLCAGTVGDVIVVAGGRSGGIAGHMNDVLTLPPGATAWEAAAPIPTSRGGAAGATLAGRFHVFGGEGNPDTTTGVFADAEAYDPSSDTWEILPPMPVPRHGFGAATVDDVIYLPGGATQQAFGAVTDVEAFSYGG